MRFPIQPIFPLLGTTLSLVLITACGGGGAGSSEEDAARPGDAPAPDAAPQGDAPAPEDTPPPDARLPDDAALPTCDLTAPPLVMAHGLLASGDTWSAHVRRFVANGECADRFHAFDWNTLDQRGDHAGALDAFVDAVRALHGVEQVDLMGHSAGGGLGYQYLSRTERAAKVRRYVHVASTPGTAPAGPAGGPVVPTMNLWSRGDTVVAGADIPGATNVALEVEDHYAVATSAAAFGAVYGFLRGDAAPATDDPTGVSGADGRVELSGRALVLGDNTPDTGATLVVYAVDESTGARLDDEPEATFEIGDDGRFGPFEARTTQRYEFQVTSARAGARPVRYFHRPFVTDDALVYLRTLPTSGLPGALLGQIPFDEAHCVVVVYLSRGALLAGRDVLALDGENVATDAIADAADTTIALFVYDEGQDGTNGGSTATFESFPFLAGLDRFIEADPTRSLSISLNGVSLDVPRRPSGSEGAAVVVFD